MTAPRPKPSTLNRLHWQNDRRRINQLTVPTGDAPAPEITKLLKVTNEFFTGHAIFRRKDGAWACIAASPVIHWMRATPYDQIKLQLLKRGCSFEWLHPNSAPTGAGELSLDTATVGSSAPSMPGTNT